MTTAEFIKKREEEQTSPVQPQVQPVSESQSTTKGDSEGLSTPVEPQSKPVSLYEIGKGIKENASIKPDEVLKSTTLNPIKTPEYEKFRNEVIGANMFGIETEEQKKKRERADFIKQGLTGFTEGLSALANLYYTTKGAPSQKYTSQMPAIQERLYRERLERDKKLENFRAWQRANADKGEEREYNLNLFNIKQEAENKAAKEKARYQAAEKAAEREFKVRFEELQQSNKKEMAELNDKLRKGQISYQEAIKLANKIAYDKTSGGKAGKIADSVIGSDGNMWTRDRPLTDNEMRQLVIAYVDDLTPWTKTEQDDIYTGKKGKTTIDYREAFADASESGKIPVEVLMQMGFKGAETSGEGDNKPPSRRENKDNDNVPPYRRK